MKKYINPRLLGFTGLILITSFFLGCKEDMGITKNKIGQKPGPVSNPKVQSISGGAYIKYDLPLSEDLRYVIAKYKLDNGIERESKSSIYNNEILVDGFGAAGEYTVELRAVAVGEVESDPITVTITALRPPYLLVLDKLKEGKNIEATFGGINLTYFNETKADIIIRVLKKDTNGTWEGIHTEYTDLETDKVRIRGLDAGPTDFGIYIEDRWDHFSDTLMVNLSPFEEIEIDKKDWKRFPLDNDAGSRGGQWDFTKIWDGNKNVGNLTKPSPLPVSIVAIDLGKPVLLSRLLSFPNNSSGGLYGLAHIYDFAVYGSNNPGSSGDWSEWTMLGRFKGLRPSGAGFSVGATSEEKSELLTNGETSEFPDPTGFEKFRYIRLRVYATWNGVYEGDAEIYLNELYLFGQL